MLFAFTPWSLAAQAPYWFRPVFPAVTYRALLATFERGGLLTELRYLRGLAQAG